MQRYVDEEYYVSIFNGKIINKEVTKYLDLAQEKIDSITHNRIVGIGFDNLTNFQKEKIQKAICYQAEYIYENGYNSKDNQNVSSYSVLDITVNVKDKDIKDKTSAEKENMSEEAYDLVHKTGLDCRNFRF